MRNLKFNSISAQNILCFGPEGIDIRFEKYGNIIQLKGINLDAPGTQEDPASNGAGKSSIPELLSIAIYGRTIKSPTKNKSSKIINTLADKGKVEVEWDDFKVSRVFNKSKSGTVTSKLDLWQSSTLDWSDETKITFGTSDETQKFIESRVGLNHHSFCNVVVFDDSNTYSFLEADGPTKRQIVENLLDLEQYRIYHENSKNLMKDFKKQIDLLGKEYNRCQEEIDSCDKRNLNVRTQEINWKTAKQNELKNLMNSLKIKQDNLGKTDNGEALSNWQNAQDKIISLINENSDLESKSKSVKDLIKIASGKLEGIIDSRDSIKQAIQGESLNSKNFENSINESLKLTKSLTNLEVGAICSNCRGQINSANFEHVIENESENISRCKNEIEKIIFNINKLKVSYQEKVDLIKNIESKVKDAQDKFDLMESSVSKKRKEIISLNSIQKPEVNLAEKVLEIEIIEIKKQIKNKKEEYEGQSPYKEILDEINKEKEDKIKQKDIKVLELESAEAELPYYEFWTEAFGDNGIRKFVVDGIIPSLNERISYWMDILIDGLIELNFDNKLEESITRKGNVAHYHNMSKGEVRRVNLAVSQSFAYVMMLNSGCCPNLVFLDEITGGGIDKAGIPFVYSMIYELSKDRQVFVTTHNEALNSMLQGSENIVLRKENDVTVLMKN